MMKRFKLTALILAASFAITLFAGIKPVSAAVRSIEKSETVQADITGDGKADSIKFAFTGEQYSYTKLVVSVNGKKALTLKEDFFMGVDYDVLKLGNGKLFLYLNLWAENGSGCKHLYAYKSGKLKKVLDFDKSVSWCNSIGDIEVKGNKLTVTMSNPWIPGLGVSAFSSSYTFKGGKFKLDNKTHKMLGYAGKDKAAEVKVEFSFDIYSDKQCTKKKATVPVGAKVKITKIYINGDKTSLYVESAKYKGWYIGYDYENEPHRDDEDFSGTYFEGAFMAS